MPRLSSLEEAVGDLVEDMKRRADLGFVSAAEVVCTGIVEGLYQARDTQSDGALGWPRIFQARRPIALWRSSPSLWSCGPEDRADKLDGNPGQAGPGMGGGFEACCRPRCQRMRPGRRYGFPHGSLHLI